MGFYNYVKGQGYFEGEPLVTRNGLGQTEIMGAGVVRNADGTLSKLYKPIRTDASTSAQKERERIAARDAAWKRGSPDPAAGQGTVGNITCSKCGYTYYAGLARCPKCGADTASMKNAAEDAAKAAESARRVAARDAVADRRRAVDADSAPVVAASREALQRVRGQGVDVRGYPVSTMNPRPSRW